MAGQVSDLEERVMLVVAEFFFAQEWIVPDRVTRKLVAALMREVGGES